MVLTAALVCLLVVSLSGCHPRPDASASGDALGYAAQHELGATTGELQIDVGGRRSTVAGDVAAIVAQPSPPGAAM